MIREGVSMLEKQRVRRVRFQTVATQYSGPVFTEPKKGETEVIASSGDSGKSISIGITVGDVYDAALRQRAMEV